MPKNLFCIIFIALITFSCQKKKEPGLFELLDTHQTGISFNNKLTSAPSENILEYDYFYMGAGVAAADFDNDGFTDLYFAGNQVSGKLYRNKGNAKDKSLQFDDITVQAGLETKEWCTGVAVADVNSDGWQDLYICHAGLKNTPNQLFINLGKQSDGSVRFKEQAKSAGVDFKGFSTQAAFVDYDKDGDADLYLLTHYHEKINPNYPKPKTSNGTSPSNDKLYRNDGKGNFTDVTLPAGINTEGFGLGIAVSDLNSDGWPDIYIANDFAYDDNIFINNQDGTFSEKAGSYLRHTSRFSMGCDIADFNNDFFPDILTVDMMPEDNKRLKMMGIASNNELFNLSIRNGYLPQYARNMLQVNNGDGSFSEIGQLAGIYKTDWSWSALFADLDNDGWKDIYITNGIPKDITNNDFTSYRDAESQMGDVSYEHIRNRLLTQVEKLEPVNKPNFAFRNNGDGLKFTDKSVEWGLATKGFSNGAVYADLDNDGDLDLVTNNLDGIASVYRNNNDKQTQNNFVRIQFRETGSLGAKIRVVCGSNVQFGEYSPYRGFLSSQETFVHFGLGKATVIDTLEVIWPDGKFQRLTNQKANQILSLKRDAGTAVVQDFSFGKLKPATSVLFSTQNDFKGIPFQHRENDYEDFNNEPLLPYRFSKNGPFMAVSDVNGDGREDVWIGGPAKIPGQLFIQQTNGIFKTMAMPDPGFEDQEGIFFDADGDKDPDLFVVSGGNEYNALTAAYQDRLYINDGKGNFSRRKESVPQEFASGKCVKAVDFDKDGDLDLFVGGRVVPGQYPSIPESFLLRNDGKGNFENVTSMLSPDLQYAGMITDAIFADMDQDGWADLVLAGEFMSVTVFHNNRGKLQKSYQSKQTGLWTSIDARDFDNDGDLDLILGNWGLNNKLNVSEKEPVSVYGVLFGKEIQPVVSYFNQGSEYSLAGRDQLVGRFPLLKKKFLTYHDFADAKMEDFFKKEDIALKFSANYLSSSLLVNNGNNSFEMKPLPAAVQFAPVNDLWIGDINKDGNQDIITIGNSFAPDFLTGRSDASCGLLLLGDGKSGFKVLTPNQSGIHLAGDMKSIASMNIAGKPIWLIGTNGMPLQALRSIGRK